MRRALHGEGAAEGAAQGAAEEASQLGDDGGSDAEGARLPVIVATDVFYSFEAIPLLVRTLEVLATPATECWLAAGRNRRAAPAFFAAIESTWHVETLKRTELDPLYQADDVDVWRLRRRERMRRVCGEC